MHAPSLDPSVVELEPDNVNQIVQGFEFGGSRANAIVVFWTLLYVQRILKMGLDGYLQ